MAGAGFSGKDGTVKIGSTDVCEIRNWKFNPKSNNPKYASNKTSGYKRTVAGVKEATGSMSGAWDNANDFLAVVDVGTDVTLKLYTNTTKFFSVPAVIDDVSVNVDVDNGEIVGWDANFSSNGAWTNPTLPMMAPAGYGDGAPMGGAPPVPESRSNPFTAEQMAQIAAVAAQSAQAAVAALFASNPSYAPPAKTYEPSDSGTFPEPVASEPVQVNKKKDPKANAKVEL